MCGSMMFVYVCTCQCVCVCRGKRERCAITLSFARGSSSAHLSGYAPTSRLMAAGSANVKSGILSFCPLPTFCVWVVYSPFTSGFHAIVVVLLLLSTCAAAQIGLTNYRRCPIGRESPAGMRSVVCAHNRFLTNLTLRRFSVENACPPKTNLARPMLCLPMAGGFCSGLSTRSGMWRS